MTTTEVHAGEAVGNQFRRSVNSQALAEFLDTLCSVNEADRDYDTIYDYDTLSNAAGCNVRTNRHVLETARRAMHAERGCEFGTVRGEGIKLLRPHEIVEDSSHDCTIIRRKSMRTIRKLANADASQLDDAQKTQLYVTSSYLGVVEMMSRKSSRKRITAACAQSQEKIDIGGITSLFGAGNGNGSKTQEG